MRTIAISSSVLAMLSAILPVVYAQDQGTAAIQKKLECEYQLTKTTADKSDIVTAGSVLVLQKDKLLMLGASGSNPCKNVYRNGAVTQSEPCAANETIKKVWKPLGTHIPGANVISKAPASRTFVTGERFWVTKIEVTDSGKERGIVFDLFSDAINDKRYATSLLIPFGRSTPTPEDALKLAQEVITVAPAEDAKQAKQEPAPQGDQGTQRAAQTPPPAPAIPAGQTSPAPAPAPIDAPPPPPSDPANVAEGQTTDQVTAALGQPLKTSKIGAKEIYFYKDMKVTFINGKVKDVQ